MTGASRSAAPVRLGVALPVFEDSPEPALRAAQACEQAGLDGVFCYDHFWPLGHPDTPARSVFPLLGAIAARTERVLLGPLVARVGLVRVEELVGQLMMVQRLSAGRLIAGLGTGDHKNAAEQAAYGLEYQSAELRREMLEEAGAAMLALGATTWVGGGAPQTNAIAARLGCPLNLWAATPERVLELAEELPVNWAGNLPRDRAAAGELLARIANAGAEWIIVHWPGSPDRLLEAAAAAGLDRQIGRTTVDW